MRCPKCRKKILGLGFSYKWRRPVEVEVHHKEDAERWSNGAETRVCHLKMTDASSERLRKHFYAKQGIYY